VEFHHQGTLWELGSVIVDGGLGDGEWDLDCAKRKGWDGTVREKGLKKWKWKKSKLTRNGDENRMFRSFFQKHLRKIEDKAARTR